MRCLEAMKVIEILRLADMQLNQSEIGTSVNCARSTVGEIIRRCRQAGLTYADAQFMSADEINELLYPDSYGKKTVKEDPDWKAIHHLLSTRKRMNLQFIWEDYRKHNPEGLSYSRFCARYKEWKNETGLNVIMPLEREPGRELFVDWIGDKLDCIVDGATGLIQSAHFFVGTLGDSSYPFVQAFPDEKIDKWLTAHVNALRWYGGIPKIIVPDNCKTAVTKANYYDPVLNKDYQALACHYGVAIIPARVRKPRDKPSVESGVGWLETWLLEWLRDQTFFSFEALNSAIYDRVRELAERPFKNRQGSRKSVFEALDKPMLRPLPLKVYEVVEHVQRKVPNNYHVEYQEFYYSVPYTACGQQVTLRATSTTIEIINTNLERISIHQRRFTGKRYVTTPEHMPEKHRYQQEKNHMDGNNYRHWASSIGDDTYATIDNLLTRAQFEEQAYRSCMGILQLAKTYGNNALNAACHKAEEMHSVTYTTIKNILKNGQETTPSVRRERPIPSHENLRSGTWE